MPLICVRRLRVHMSSASSTIWVPWWRAYTLLGTAAEAVRPIPKKYHLRTEQVGFGHTKAMPTMPMQLCNGRRQACGAQRCWRTPAGCAA